MCDPLYRVEQVAISLKASSISIACSTFDKGIHPIPVNSMIYGPHYFMAPYISFSPIDGSLVDIGTDAKYDLSNYSVNLLSTEYVKKSRSKYIRIGGKKMEEVAEPFQSLSNSSCKTSINSTQEVHYDENINSFLITTESGETKCYTRSYLLGKLIKKIKEDTEVYLGHSISEVLVSVSANINYLEKVELKKSFMEGDFQEKGVRFILQSGVSSLYAMDNGEGFTNKDSEINGILVSTNEDNLEFSFMVIDCGIIEMKETKTFEDEGEATLLDQMLDYCLDKIPLEILEKVESNKNNAGISSTIHDNPQSQVEIKEEQVQEQKNRK